MPALPSAGLGHPGPETVALLMALLHGDWDTADASGTPTRQEASGLVAAHLQWHLERQLRSLPLVDRRARVRPAAVVAPGAPGTAPEPPDGGAATPPDVLSD